jgi:uncharacterized membrane protein YvbJ
MALIKCPECGTEVSDRADSCPKCAYPITGGGTTQAHGGKIQTIEQTSKKYKLQQLLSTFLTIGSFIVMIVGFSGESSQGAGAFGMLGFIVGLIWFIGVRFISWWHHG